MNLDDFQSFPTIDARNILAEIDGLPDQLQLAWNLGQTLPLPGWRGIQRVVIAGMGGSAIGADLLNAYLAPICPTPLTIVRNYTLPAWARGKETLMIAASHSGNTEETLSAFDQALRNGCRVLAVCTGGKLAELAGAAGVPLWQFEHRGQPRAAVGYSFGLLLALFARLELIPNPAEDLAAAIAAMRAQQAWLRADVPIARNPAKRLAGQCVGRWVAVLAADHLVPVARRWKGQVSELAKAWGQFEELPEADHNTQAGVVNPAAALGQTMVLFLRSAGYHPRNLLRANLTKEIFMLEGLGTDFVDASGDSPLAQIWTALHFGDYTAYYLAMAYEVDPTPVDAIESLKMRLKQTPQ